MRYYSTRGKNNPFSFAEAALTGLAPDGGLFVPEEVPLFPTAVKTSLGNMTFTEIAFETIRLWTGDDIPETFLLDIVNTAYPFDAPLVKVGDRLVLELFHGPSAAFKDFGARFMARTFSFLRRNETRPLKILVATSGDTGGAVAEGFFGIEGINVTVLYPKGKVSLLQEKQIAGLGGNINAIAVEGSFDDCQRLVKEAFRDETLKSRHVFSSANSINICRLIPQAVYYAAASGKAENGLIDPDKEATPRKKNFTSAEAAALNYAGGKATVCVPSGNYGNLTAGLYAWKMGAPIENFIAASNINKTVPDFLISGNYEPRPSKATLSNAMDVGAPSNFERMSAHFSWKEMKQLIYGTSVDDEETKETIKDVFSSYGYYLDPHSAVGWKAADKIPANKDYHNPLIILSTAHPAKFAETIVPVTGEVPLPPSLKKTGERTVNAALIPAKIEALRDCL